MKIEEAYQFCERMAKSHYENFPVGSLMIPKEKRPYVWSIYAFARTADDFADENYPSRKDFSDDATWREAIRNGEAGRLEKLEEWGSELAACYEGTPTHPIFLALSKTIDDLKIPQRLLSDLLSAFRMDVTTRRHADWDSVLHYCRHSADPVGRLVLWTFGYRDEELFSLSDAICTGLQLANFWQDIAVDRDKDRIYIPQSVFERRGSSPEALFDPSARFPEGEILQDLFSFTVPFFQKGAPLPSKVTGRLGWELKLTWLGGMKILRAACGRGRGGFQERPALTTWDKFTILCRSFFGYGRATAAAFRGVA